MQLIRGWCPDLFAPMRSGDGWLLRIKPSLGRLHAADARRIADAAAVCGNGIIELTGRGNLQLRGLSEASAARFARFAVAAGLAAGDPAIERRRNILVSPLADEAARAVACALERGLAAESGLAALPGKFGFGIDAGSPWRLPATAADILLRRHEAGWEVGLAGETPQACDTADAPALALALARDWLARGDVRRPARAAGDAAGSPVPVGWLATHGAFGVGLPFGQMDCALLSRLSGLAERFGEPVLHLTPWRVVLLSGIAAADVPALADATRGLVTAPGDARLRVSACIGRAGCASGSVDARADALSLLAAATAPGLAIETLHVSGCAKGCAHPGPAALTLVGQDGRYGLVRAGRAGDTPEPGALTLAEVQGVLDQDRV